MTQIVKIWRVGELHYKKALKLQKILSDIHHKENVIANTILLLEHPPVYTTGIRSSSYTEQDELRLKSLGAEFYRSNRGGLITFHGPGQLVVYPIINLQHFTPKIRWYVNQLESTIINLLHNDYGLIASRSERNTGVWIGDNKICAIGVHGSRYITTHGLALNCSINLEWFEHIVPCGIEDRGVTSLSKELGKIVNVDTVIPAFLKSFSNLFQCTYTDFPEKEAHLLLSNL